MRPLQVKEGGLRELTPALLNARDLDAPPDVLTFTVLEPPSHGSLVQIGGTALPRYGGEGAGLPQRGLHVSSFSLQELQQGETLTRQITPP